MFQNILCLSVLLSIGCFSLLFVSQCYVTIGDSSLALVICFCVLLGCLLSVVCSSVPCYGCRLIKCVSRVQMVSRLTGRYRSQCHSRQPCPHSAGLSILSTLLSLHSCTSSLQLLLKCHSTDFTAWCSVPVSLATTLPAAVW